MERDCGQKGSYNKAGVIALGGNARFGQAGKSSYKMNGLSQPGQLLEQFLVRHGASGGVQFGIERVVGRCGRLNRFSLMLRIGIGVYLRGFELRMSEPLGDVRQIHSRLIQVHGAAVAEKMRIYAFGNFRANPAGFFPVFLKEIADSSAG